MFEKLKAYVTKFRQADVQHVVQAIDNEHAYAWLAENMPLFACPDKTLEEIYYFRFWVYRKHIKETEDGRVITEFLPPVRWAGKHNTIVAAVEHHVNEGKWLKCGKEILSEYLAFWLSGKGDAFRYSTPLVYAVLALCEHTGDYSFGVKHLPALIAFYETVAEEHRAEDGLFWSIDNYDAMEYSISGTGENKLGQRHALCVPPSAAKREDLISAKGLRPTLNSYMAANAYALAELAHHAGDAQTEAHYREVCRKIVEAMCVRLWQDDFFYATHQTEKSAFPPVRDLPAERKAKELIGYIPFCYPYMPKGYETAFSELIKSDGFLCEHGLTTAEQRHSRYLYQVEHECLWNGYVWPFATSQVIGAVYNLLRNYTQDILTEDDAYAMLSAYAKSQYRMTENGERVCWIDEVLHPITGDWSSRTTLKEWGWPERKGGVERGKDYNHSTFGDLVLGKLLGISFENGQVVCRPKIPKTWKFFAVENLHFGGDRYAIYFDADGTKYGKGAGLHIIKQ